MILIVENDQNHIAALKEYFKDPATYQIAEAPQQLPVLFRSSPWDVIIAGIDALNSFSSGGLHLALLGHQAKKLILIASEDGADTKAPWSSSVTVLSFPLDLSKLKEALQTKESPSQDASEAPADGKGKNLSRLRDHIFCNLLEGHDIPQNMENTLTFLGLSSDTDKYYLSLVFSFLPAAPYGSFEEAWKNSLIIQRIAREELSKIVTNRSCVQDANRIAFLILIQEPGDPFRYTLEKILEKIEKRVRRECSHSITVGIGLASDLTDDITISYRQACDALNQGYFFGNSPMCFFSDLYTRDSQRFQLSRSIKESIIKYVYQEEFDKIDQLIEREFCNILQLGLATRDNILALKIDLTVFLMDLSNKLSIVSEKPKIYSSLLNDFLTADSLPSLEIVIKEKLRELSIASHTIQEKRTERLIQNTRSIVLAQLEEPINVQLIAQRLRISPNYLSAIFKSGTGVRLTEYITNVKMREAARLLRETQKNITEITALVGYDNANYFSRLFKKQYGTTPSEYRHSSEPY